MEFPLDMHWVNAWFLVNVWWTWMWHAQTWCDPAPLYVRDTDGSGSEIDRGVVLDWHSNDDNEWGIDRRDKIIVSWNDVAATPLTEETMCENCVEENGIQTSSIDNRNTVILKEDNEERECEASIENHVEQNENRRMKEMKRWLSSIKRMLNKQRWSRFEDSAWQPRESRSLEEKPKLDGWSNGCLETDDSQWIRRMFGQELSGNRYLRGTTTTP